MIIRIVSDLHLERGEWFLPEVDGDSDTVLVLAGDIGVVAKELHLIKFLNDVCSRFKEVLYVFGNHDYWDGNISFCHDKLRGMTTHLNNLHILENALVELDGVSFFGCTLWTDFNKCDPLTLYSAAGTMKDYKKIRQHKGYHTMWSEDFLTIHRNSIRHIKSAFSERGGKKVLITHHGVSFMSVHPRFEGDYTNGLYHSDLSNLLMDLEIDLAIHGHTHDSFDYMIDKTRVICNPRGYDPSELNPYFDRFLTVDL